VNSSEDLFTDRTYRQYPLTHLFDGDPATAWVYSAPSKRPEGYDAPLDRYALEVVPEKIRTFDGLRIMNGYNRTDATFLGNRRVTKITIYDPYDWEKKRPIKTVTLSDRAGWHTIRLPRRNYESGLRIVFKDFAGAKGLDVAISELQLLDRGRPIRMNLPNAVLATEGSSCGCGTVWSAMNRRGEILANSDWSEGDSSSLDSRGRYAAGIERKGKRTARVWVVDLRSARVVRTRRLHTDDELETKWQGRRLRVEGFPKEPLSVIRL
jgi:hypothetical protein